MNEFATNLPTKNSSPDDRLACYEAATVPD